MRETKMTKEQLARLSDDQLRALSDDEFWNAIEPAGLCPCCDDARLNMEAYRRNGVPETVARRKLAEAHVRKKHTFRH